MINSKNSAYKSSTWQLGRKNRPCLKNASHCMVISYFCMIHTIFLQLIGTRGLNFTHKVFILLRVLLEFYLLIQMGAQLESGF